MNDRTRRWVLTGGGLAAAVIIGVGAVIVWSGHSPATTGADKPKVMSAGQVAQQFVNGLINRELGTAASATDAPEAAGAVLRKTHDGMAESRYSARLGELPVVAEGAGSTTITADVTWTLPDNTLWKYAISLDMRRDGDGWKVHWAPTALHPQLAEGQALAYRVASGAGSLVDRDGTPVEGWDISPDILATVRSSVGALQGSDGWKIVAVDQAGAEIAVLNEKPAKSAPTVTTTLALGVQKAASNAVGGQSKRSMIVAIQPSTGEVLAVAGASALTGLYEPGSTFKIVTAAAVLQHGLAGPNTQLSCPEVITVGQRTIRNAGFGFDSVPLHTAFAKSCNTTFVQLAGQLPRTALADTAKQFGIGVDFTVEGVTTNTGRVDPAASDAAQVENSIGQGTVRTSPFGMAVAAATVASGKVITPTILRGTETTVAEERLVAGPGVLQALRSMMREVVTSGTATQLGRFGASGKTGTAEFGTAGGAHGWFVGYRGDVAFAVLAEDAGTSDLAVDVTADFLAGLG